MTTMQGIRRVLAAMATVCILAGAALVTTQADAAVVHRKQGTFNGSDTPSGPFSGIISSDAVDLATGDVYVADDNIFEGRFRVDRFNSEGAYAGVEITGTGPGTPHESFAFGIFNSGIAVDNTASGPNKSDLYVADTEHHVLDRFGAGGEFLCQIAGAETEAETPSAKECAGAKGSGLIEAITPAGVAVDPSGNVFVADDAHEAIDEFGPSGEYLSQIKDSHLSNEMTMLALDPGGALYVLNGNPLFNESPSVLKFESGHFASVLDTGPSHGVGVDQVTGHVYVMDTLSPTDHHMSEYEPSGTLLDATNLGEASFNSIAVGSAGRIYGAESPLFSPGDVAIYTGDLVTPNVTTGPATAAGETTATLTGTLDPDAAHGGGEISECRFEYGPTEGYGQSAPCAGGAPFSGAVTANLTGLARSSLYHFRLEAANADKVPAYGTDGTFTTVGAPVIDRQSSRVNGVGVVVTAQINPFHFDTTCQVRYVDDAGFKASGYATATTLACAPEDVGSGLGDVAANVTLTGLKVGATYHYRFLATNQAGLTGGADRTFQTFGVHAATFELLDNKEAPFTQAGGHPYELRTGFTVNRTENVGGEPFAVHPYHDELPTGNVRTVITDLPPGLIGDPSATPKCTRAEVISFRCSGAAQVGVFEVDEAAGENFVDGIYNLVPPEGVAAEFGANIEQHLTVHIDARLRSGGGYTLTAESQNNSAVTGVAGVRVHLWGVPADPSHDQERCPQLRKEGERFLCPEPHAAGAPEAPLLFNPTSCGGPLTTVLAVDSYQASGLFDEHVLESPPVTGCDKLGFAPTLQATPTSSAADSPTGLHVDLHVPQKPMIEDPEATREADLRDATVTLPAGLTTNPSAANGLQGCSPAQVGVSSASGASPVTFTEAPAACPDASKIGTVEVDTPLIDHPLPGAVYIASPHENPFGSLLAIYIAIDDPQSGVVLKLAGDVHADPVTGQLTTTFADNPQVPFEDFKLDFFEGPRAALATPEGCGAYATSSSLTPWSSTTAVNASAEPFSISSGCVTGFTPAFTAGTASPQAGAFSPFTLSFSRSDSEQGLAGINVTLPPGLIGKIAGIPRCTDAQIAAAAANKGAAEQAASSCPAASQIGTVQSFAGAGPNPVQVPGKAYLTGPYKGAPYGVAVIVPALAGPFDLGTVVIRQALHIDPNTAQVTAVSDPFPTILQGIPLRLKRVDVTVDRPSFTFNPTSCNPMAISATLTSAGGLSAPVSSRFQVGGCGELAFKPSFKVSTSGKTSRKNGASLDVKLTYPTGSFGKYANIRSVKVNLPKQLPSRLTTLQKACRDSTFNANPAACPAASRVGTATATTPILETTLTGPAYFVSHGGAKFPELIVVLSGQGITIDLHGETFISKAGITSSTFRQVPDVPVQSFELKLPQGPDSALAANGNLCTSTLAMPTAFTAQNGAVIHQSTPINVTGCKPSIAVMSQSVKGNTATIVASVPSAGRLVATGAEIKRSVKRVGKAGTVTIGVTLTSHGLRVLAKNPHQRVNANVKLRFTPEHGAPLTAYVRLLLG